MSQRSGTLYEGVYWGWSEGEDTKRHSGTKESDEGQEKPVHRQCALTGEGPCEHWTKAGPVLRGPPDSDRKDEELRT